MLAPDRVIVVEAMPRMSKSVLAQRRRGIRHPEHRILLAWFY